MDNLHELAQIEQCIKRMSALVRRELAHDVARSFGEDPDAHREGWWVLACGDELDENSFDEREEARNLLLSEVEVAGVVLPEHVWVWDEARRAQLVITTMPTKERAERVAEVLREKGLTIRVRREKL